MSEKEGELYRIIPLATQLILKAKSQVHSETLKLENVHDPLDNVRRIGEILDEAAKDLFSTVHEPCYSGNEAGCHEPDWRIYYSQPEDCPLRKLEKWFGEAQK